MDTKLLHYFIVIAQERNMTRAAEKLFVSQSSLSYHISKLEADVGTPLFLRAKSDLLLTPAGELYLDAAKKVVAIKDQLYQKIHTLDNRGTIRICINSLWGDRMMADILPTFQKSFPGLSFELFHSDDQEMIQKKLADGEVDYGLLSVPFFEAADQDKMEYLCPDELLFAVPGQHPFVRQHPGSVLDQAALAEAFWEAPILISKKTSANYRLMEQLFLQHRGALPPHLCEVNGIPLTCTLVMRGAGVSFVPASGRMLEEEIHYYSCRPRLIRHNVLMHRENLLFNKPEQLFFDCMKNYYRTPPVETGPASPALK